ncbi:MAG TPA: hypothetical protein VD994_14330 [Prosthecobacter sp.]|nr:hypothetical protein [Prosthecobacter sp.]
MNSPAVPPVLSRLVQHCAAGLLLLALTNCGKKEETPPPPPAPPTVEASKAPAVETPKAPAADAPAAKATAPTPPEAPKAAPDMREPAEPKKAADEAKQAPAQRSGDATAWARWDAAAERMRTIGATVRESTDPRRLEVVVNPMTDSEIRAIARSAYQTLGGGEVSVILYDASGAQVGQATIDGVKGR